MRCMTPVFLLDLGPTRIRLLERTEDGRALLEETETGAADMAPRLRQAVRAAAGDAMPLAAELVLPAEQMLFTEVPAPQPGADDPGGLIARAMEGRTPYPLDEIALDWVVSDGVAHVAAVALETLEQATSFAAALGVEAEVFSARPDAGAFPREPRFAPAVRPAAGDEGGPGFVSTRTQGSAASGEAGADRPGEADTRPSAETEEASAVMGAKVTSGGLPDPEEAAQDVARSRESGAAITAPVLPGPAATEPAGTGPSASEPENGTVPALPHPPLRTGGLPSQLDDAQAAAPHGKALIAGFALAIAFVGGLAYWGSQLGAGPETGPDLVVIGDGSAPGAEALEPETAAVDIPDPAPPELAPSPVDPGIASAPMPPAAPRPADTGATGPELRTTSIDTETAATDAFALPSPDDFAAGPLPAVSTPPPAPGDSSGEAEVAAAEEPAIPEQPAPQTFAALPDPPVAPPVTPLPAETDPLASAASTADVVQTTPTETDAPFGALPPSDLAAALPETRPRARPSDVVAQYERARFGGRTLEELASFRPRERPASPQDSAPQQPPTEQAVAQAPAPPARPEDMEEIVATALLSAQPSEVAAASTAAVAVAPAPGPAAPAPQSAAPPIPTRAEVAREATMEDVLRLNRLNLIGVYGGGSDRRALLRLPSGRFVKVQVGDRVDGGQVAAIGESELRYVKGGQNITLTIPSG